MGTIANRSASKLLSIIIASYCTRDLLRDCLTSLYHGGLTGTEIIVVDNASNDGTVAMLKAEFPEVRVLQNKKNAGFARANNQGIRASDSKYVLLLNSDTIVKSGCVQAMIEFMEQHPETGAAASRLRFADGRIQASASRTSKGIGITRLLWRLSGIGTLSQSNRLRKVIKRTLGSFVGFTIREYLDSYEAESPMEAELLSGTCLMLRGEAINQVGLLDETFFMYLEDLDYCIRLNKAGWKLYYLPAAEIIHLGGQSSSGRMRKYKAESYRSLFFFYQKHCPSWKLKVARFLVFAVFCFRWAWSFGRQLGSANTIYRKNCSDIAEILHLCYKWRRAQRSSTKTTSLCERISRPGQIAGEADKEEVRA